jgi:DNA-binding LytR/AlgR family response regulator
VYPGAETIPVTVGTTTKLIPKSAIRWVQARGDYARLHTANGSYLIRAAMTALTESLASVGMVRIHRSYLVQLRHIAEVGATDSGALSVVVDGHRLPVSRRAAPRLRGVLDQARMAPVGVAQRGIAGGIPATQPNRR